MSKKLAVLMTIICVGLVAFVVWTRLGADKTGPEITCSNENLVYHDGMTNSELLENVTAYDAKDGDVTDSLAVESAYPVENGQVVVVYVAKDKSNNVTKSKQFYSYDSAASDNTESEGTPEETDASGAEDKDADAYADHDAQLPEGEAPSDMESGETAGELSDTDGESSEGEELRKEQEAKAEQMPAGNPRIYLTDYLIKVPVGTTVDRLSYVKEITDDSDNVYDLWTKIQITGTLDTLTAGTYECTYYVVDSQGNTSNQAVLRFIVE